jgi:hypothetical protein
MRRCRTFGRRPDHHEAPRPSLTGAAPRISTEGRQWLSTKGHLGTIGDPLPVLSPPGEALRVLPRCAGLPAQRRQSEYPLARPSLFRVNGFCATAINGQRYGRIERIAPADSNAHPAYGAHDGHPAMDMRSNANASVHPNTPRAEAVLCGKL